MKKRPTYLPVNAYDIIVNWETGEISYYVSDNPNNEKFRTIILPKWLTDRIRENIEDAREQGEMSVGLKIRKALGI